MILRIYSKTSHLSELKACSRPGGDFFVGSQNFKNTRETNGTVHTVFNIIKILMVSAADAEVGALFHNGQES